MKEAVAENEQGPTMPLPRAWTLPEGLPVINVDNEAKLEGCR